MATFLINGTIRAADVAGEIPLLWVLREALGLTGTKYGCGVAQCGACTVHVDGRATRSCVTPATAVQSRAVVTIEGVSGDIARAVQDAWRRLDVAQCGYCQSGQIMSAIALLSEIRRPSDADINAAMSQQPDQQHDRPVQGDVELETLPHLDIGSGGRRSAHGAAASNAAAARSTLASSRQRPTIWSPTGSPSRVKPQGTEMAGRPTTVNAYVRSTHWM